MYLSAERLALINQEVRETFAYTCISWQAIPHWDVGDPGQTRIRRDSVYLNKVAGGGGSVGLGPLGKASLVIRTKKVRFYVTLAQATAPSADAMLAAVTARAAELAAKVDAFVIPKLWESIKLPPEELQGVGANYIMNELIDARVRIENAGFRAPSALFTNKEGLKRLSFLEDGYSVLPLVLDASHVNALYRIRTFEELPVEPDELEDLEDPVDPADDDDITDEVDEPTIQMLVLGRRQLIPQGGAPSATSGEEPVDLAVSVFPSIEIVGETANGNIELAVRIQFALRVKDVRALIAVVDEVANVVEDDGDNF
jgi:hypothetical protein